MTKLAIATVLDDRDEQHFDRFKAELKRLGLPCIAVLSNCSEVTERYFYSLFVDLTGVRGITLPSGENPRGAALPWLAENRFDAFLQLEVHETLEERALQKLTGVKELIARGFDLLKLPVSHLWGDHRHRLTSRVDQDRVDWKEKVFNLRTGMWVFPTPTTMVPRLYLRESLFNRRAVQSARVDLAVTNWGLMNLVYDRGHLSKVKNVKEIQ